MKKVFYLFALVSLLVFITVPLPSRASPAVQKKMAIARFDKTVMVQGIALKGEYLFVHDDAAMQRGEACTYIYKGNAPMLDKLVTSFHCVPTERSKANHFVFRTAQVTPDVMELREFQFGGDTEAHGIPLK